MIFKKQQTYKILIGQVFLKSSRFGRRAAQSNSTITPVQASQAVNAKQVRLKKSAQADASEECRRVSVLGL